MIHKSLPLPAPAREQRRLLQSTHWAPASATINLAKEPSFRIGDLVVTPMNRTIGVQNGAQRSIEPRLMQVLILLSRRRNALVSRDEFLERCWSGLAVSNDAIERVIGKLRKLEAELASGNFQIITVPKVGYRLQVAKPDLVSVDALGRKRGISRRSMLTAIGWSCLSLSVIGVLSAAAGLRKGARR
jgi:DNA-binding winged helix-turn-helix (wHTH) protein